MSLTLKKTIVDQDGSGFVQFNVQEDPIPSDADLKDDQVRVAPSDLFAYEIHFS